MWSRNPVADRVLLGLFVVVLCLAFLGCQSDDRNRSREKNDARVDLHEIFARLDHDLARRDLTNYDAATFAWREAPIIESYMTMYEVTDDEDYLEKAHVLLEMAFENLESWNGFEAWTTDLYSVALVRTAPAVDNKGDSVVMPTGDRVMDAFRATQVTGLTYRITFHEPNSYELYVTEPNGERLLSSDECPEMLGERASEPLTHEHEWVHQVAEAGNNYWSVNTRHPLLKDPDLVSLRRDGVTVEFGRGGDDHWDLRDDGRLNIWLPLGERPWDRGYTVEYTVVWSITAIPGIFLRLAGRPEIGDEFIVATERVRRLPYLVHDGVILRPALRFIKGVLADDTLGQRWGGQAREWLDRIRLHIIPKWDRWWMQEGYYLQPGDPAYRYPGEHLPFNQFLAFGRSLFLLHDITHEAKYLDYARQMAEYFKGQLSLMPNGAYVWQYNPTVARFEDTSHANLVIGFVIDAFDRGVFDESDMKRFTKTFLELMWNGSLDDPEVGTYINEPTVREGARNFRVQEWVLLATVEPQMWEVCKSLIPKQRQQSPCDANLTLQLIANLIWLQKRESRP